MKRVNLGVLVHNEFGRRLEISQLLKCFDPFEYSMRKKNACTRTLVTYDNVSRVKTIC